MEKFKVDIFNNIEKESVQKQIHDTLFKVQPIKSKNNVDPMQIALSILSDPKKIKKILIAISITSITGIITIVYLSITQLITLTEYLYKHF